MGVMYMMNAWWVSSIMTLIRHVVGVMYNDERVVGAMYNDERVVGVI